VSEILERIEREAGVPGLAKLLAERLEPTDLQSLLLEVYRLRARQRSPSDLLADYATNRFVRPSAAPPKRLLEWEAVAVSQLPPEFELVALSPVCPLGTCSVVASVDQNKAVSTSRNTEVISDSTNVVALEAALRRRERLRGDPRSAEPVHLAASHRLLRAQRFEGPNLYAHFSLFALCSAGRDRGGMRFEVAALGFHVRFYLRALRAFLGPDVPLRVSASDFAPNPRNALLESELLPPIQEEFEGVQCAIDSERTEGRGYYPNLCFNVRATTPLGRVLTLVDGGSVDWTQKLLNNGKERLVTSGIGSERVCVEFPIGGAAP
jgi:hypothetical protein